jgi:hypothetical protein
MKMNGGNRMLEMAKDLNQDQRVQKYLAEEVRKFITELKI